MVILFRLGFLLMSGVALVTKTLETEKAQIMDSEFSYHMCPRNKYFDTLDLKKGGVVQLGNNNRFKVHGIGML